MKHPIFAARLLMSAPFWLLSGACSQEPSTIPGASAAQGAASTKALRTAESAVVQPRGDAREGPKGEQKNAPSTSAGLSGPLAPCTNDVAAPTRALRLTRDEYIASMKDVPGATEALLAGHPRMSITTDYDNFNATLYLNKGLVEYYETNARSLAPALAAEMVKKHKCLAAANVGDDCLKGLVAERAMTHFRRPPTGAEAGRYLAFLKNEVRESGKAPALEAFGEFLLRSPHFLFKVEVGGLGDTPDERSRMAGFERASVLAFMLTGAPPDAALLEAAAKGGLSAQDPQILRSHAKRLLSKPEARARLSDFILQWVDAKRHDGSFPKKDPELFPEYGAALHASMTKEVEAFAQHVIFDATGRLDMLMTSDVTFVDDAMARFYGVAKPSGLPASDVARNGMVKASPPGRDRKGLFTKPLVFTSLSDERSTRHVHRASIMKRRYLCESLPNPPDTAQALGEEIAKSAPKGNEKAKYEHFLSVARPECVACHKSFEPLGLAVETFDAIGRVRDKDGAFDVDPAGEVFLYGKKVAFQDSSELIDRAVESPAFDECFARHAFSYLQARHPRASGDSCVLKDSAASFRASDRRILDLVVELAVGGSLLERNGGEAPR